MVTRKSLLLCLTLTNVGYRIDLISRVLHYVKLVKLSFMNIGYDSKLLISKSNNQMFSLLNKRICKTEYFQILLVQYLIKKNKYKQEKNNLIKYYFYKGLSAINDWKKGIKGIRMVRDFKIKWSYLPYGAYDTMRFWRN